MNEEQLVNVLATICSISLIVFLITYLIYIFIYYLLKENKQKDYIKTLDEHDKAIICSYKAIKPFERKKKKHE